MNKKQEEALAKEFQQLFNEMIKKENQNAQSPTKQAENSQAQESSGAIKFFDSFYINIIQVKISQAIIINQNTIQFAENSPKGQENGSSDDGKGSKQPTSTRNLAGNNANDTTTPPIPTNATTMQDDDERQGTGNNEAIRDSSVKNTSTFGSNGSLPQDERTLDNNRQCDTRESTSTARSRQGRAESRESRAVGEGLKEFKAIYGIEIKPNEAELRELELKVIEWDRIHAYSPSAAQSELDKFLQENIQEFRKNESRYLESSKHKLYANFAVAIRVCQILNYEPSREKTEEIKKILGVKQLKVNVI